MEKAFYRIRKERGIKHELIANIKSLYKDTSSYVRVKNERSKSFISRTGLKQGCILSPLLFNVVLDKALKRCKNKLKKYHIGNGEIESINITELYYADDLVIVGKRNRITV